MKKLMSMCARRGQNWAEGSEGGGWVWGFGGLGFRVWGLGCRV